MTSSSSSVLRQPFIATDPHVMGATEHFYIDPITAQRTEDAHSAGYEQGFADGARAAEATARRSADAAADALRVATAQAVSDLSATTIDLVPALMDTAIAIARHLVLSVPEQLTASLVERLQHALVLIDDEQLTIYVSESDRGVVQSGFGAVANVTLALDPSLQTGEARIEGTWARADLTLQTAWNLIAETQRG